MNSLHMLINVKMLDEPGTLEVGTNLNLLFKTHVISEVK